MMLSLSLSLLFLWIGTVTKGIQAVEVTSSSSSSSSSSSNEASETVADCDKDNGGECLASPVGQEDVLYPCTEEFLKDYWHDDPVPGFHIACLSSTINNPGGQQQQQEKKLNLKIFRNGVANDPVLCENVGWNWMELKTRCLEDNDDDEEEEDESKQDGLNILFDPDEFQPYAIYSPLGQRLADGSDTNRYSSIILNVLLKTGVWLIYEGGQFLWPGVRIGFERHNVPLDRGHSNDDEWDEWEYDHEDDEDDDDGKLESRRLEEDQRTVTITTLSLKPLVVSIQGFLSPDECTHIQTRANDKVEYSGVVLMDKDKGRPDSDFRTSQSTFLFSTKDGVLRKLETRVARLARIPRLHQEPVQVLRYGFGEKYDQHTDYFDPELYSQDDETLSLIQGGRRNRLATVFWYLTNVTQGGETSFPDAVGDDSGIAVGMDAKERARRRHNLEQDDLLEEFCVNGPLMVKPEEGKVIIFYSLLMTGEVDPLSLHAACPVKEGLKWAANKWIWNEPMDYIE